MRRDAPAALAEGAIFHGRYQIVRCIAAGGMGAVYECVHLTTRKHRALKVMLPQARIESEHIVETFDAGVDEATGSPFLVMELLQGEDLESLLHQQGPFTPQEVVVLLSQAAMAHDKTHAAGIVHRDPVGAPSTVEPSVSLPLTSRTPLAVVALGGVVALAAGLFGVVGAFQRPTTGQAPATVVTASAARTSAPQPRSEAPPATTGPTVEPLGPAASASPSPSSAPPAERPKKTYAAPPQPAPIPTPAATPKAAPNCNPPFSVDPNGVKHAKPECL
jgi:hypothetical protein